MRRREFIALVGGAAASPVCWQRVARAQQAMPVIGFLGPGSATGQDAAVSGLRRGLGEAGFVDGRNVAFEFRWADSQTGRLPALASELVRRPVAVIVTAGATAAALAAKNATSTIPIVFAVGADPVKFGLVASMNRPGGNVTGVSFLANVLVAKQVELLRELVPTAAVIGVLVNPSNPNAASDTKDVEAAATALGLQARVVHATSERDLDAAFTSLAAARAGALLVFPDALFTSSRGMIAALASDRHLPAIYNRLYVEAGGLVSYGASQAEAYREAGNYAGRILKGEKPADLPVVQSARFELVINLKAARALGLDIPPTLLARADEVIE